MYEVTFLFRGGVVGITTPSAFIAARLYALLDESSFPRIFFNFHGRKTLMR